MSDIPGDNSETAVPGRTEEPLPRSWDLADAGLRALRHASDNGEAHLKDTPSRVLEMENWQAASQFALTYPMVQDQVIATLVLAQALLRKGKPAEAKAVLGQLQEPLPRLSGWRAIGAMEILRELWIPLGEPVGSLAGQLTERFLLLDNIRTLVEPLARTSRLHEFRAMLAQVGDVEDRISLVNQVVLCLAAEVRVTEAVAWVKELTSPRLQCETECVVHLCDCLQLEGQGDKANLLATSLLWGEQGSYIGTPSSKIAEASTKLKSPDRFLGWFDAPRLKAFVEDFVPDFALALAKARFLDFSIGVVLQSEVSISERIRAQIAGCFAGAGRIQEAWDQILSIPTPEGRQEGIGQIAATIAEIGQLEEALALMQTIDAPEALHWSVGRIALALAKAGRVKEAEPLSARTANTSYWPWPQRRMELYTLLTRHFLETGQQELAETWVKAIPDAARRYDASAILFDALVDQGRLDEAREFAEDVGPAPDSAFNTVRINRIPAELVRLGRVEEAVQLACRYQSAQSRPGVLFHLSQALIQQGRMELGLATFLEHAQGDHKDRLLELATMATKAGGLEQVLTCCLETDNFQDLENLLGGCAAILAKEGQLDKLFAVERRYTERKQCDEPLLRICQALTAAGQCGRAELLAAHLLDKGLHPRALRPSPGDDPENRQAGRLSTTCFSGSGFFDQAHLERVLADEDFHAAVFLLKKVEVTEAILRKVVTEGLKKDLLFDIVRWADEGIYVEERPMSPSRLAGLVWDWGLSEEAKAATVRFHEESWRSDFLGELALAMAQAGHVESAIDHLRYVHAHRARYFMRAANLLLAQGKEELFLRLVESGQGSLPTILGLLAAMIQTRPETIALLMEPIWASLKGFDALQQK
jgi:hypothetical protein